MAFGIVTKLGWPLSSRSSAVVANCAWRGSLLLRELPKECFYVSAAGISGFTSSCAPDAAAMR